ncbi:hypothetical protein EDB69_3201 [Vibrio crassostreae]|uniref:hypothetical protein n=1 Tax=Vibrio TaxID=662 RepID=UPI000977849D|nr:MULTISPECIES: hypothetical protein [Vibrio]OMO22301.1 hypothetical protein BH583_08985 [Vibrio lentus]ROO70416.1 hypothetical protein EDB64_2921 [Vibrio crassostreae]ROP08655.1 hypothetical protein EDB63_2659 [Vibrio crassostreae]RPE91453.1 hypothetical protein EDB68_2662 [Vibrio crassostreae]RPF14712.1 hypothetical protein EDB69_3201 [Vibrio crassostreae]
MTTHANNHNAKFVNTVDDLNELLSVLAASPLPFNTPQDLLAAAQVAATLQLSKNTNNLRFSFEKLIASNKDLNSDIVQELDAIGKELEAK